MKQHFLKRLVLMMMPVSLIFAVIFGNAVAAGGTGTELADVVRQHGQLQVVGSQLCDARGVPIQLKGVSSHGLQWFPFSKNTLKNFISDWHISVVRAAMYTVEGGYIGNESQMKQRVKELVDQAIEDGIYVIIDWHILSDNDPNIHKTEAQSFFAEMARTYGNYPNVIYEICNEPNQVTWNRAIKPYAEYVIPAIRAVDPDNIIIVGTDTWSQGVDAPADNPLNFKQIMYALHFYAGTHTKWLRDRADAALAKGIALFVTEWGTTQASGSGGVYRDEAQRWIDWMADQKISWCNWSVSNKSEDSAIFKPRVSLDGPWRDSDLTESGLWVKSKILSEH
ncbi:MAG TPA: glycoside hydrolase family 5 protein [Bacillota bacterium]